MHHQPTNNLNLCASRLFWLVLFERILRFYCGKNLVKTQGCMKQEAVRCSKFQDDWTCLAYQPSTNFATLLAKKNSGK